MGLAGANRLEVIKDLIRLTLLSNRTDGKYFLFVSDSPASESLQSTRGHPWVHKLFEESSDFTRIDILEGVTEKDREHLRGYIRSDDKAWIISGKCLRFELVSKTGNIANSSLWYGYLLRIDRYAEH